MMDSPNEKEAISRLKHGDISGLETLVRAYQVQAVGAADLITRDLAQAQDIVQTAFLRVYEHIQQFDDSRAFSPWFLKIVINDALKYAKQDKRFIHLDQSVGSSEEYHLEDIPASPEASPEVLAEIYEDRHMLWNALGKLPPNQRAVVVLHYYLELSTDEISDELASPQSTIRWRLHKAKQRLGVLLAPIQK
jgi:RNA polymerase sigma-70 factor (ECF subfamily)